MLKWGFARKKSDLMNETLKRDSGCQTPIWQPLFPPKSKKRMKYED